MKDFRILILLDKFKAVFERFGVDYSIMRRILQVKLAMDERRVPTVMKDNSSKKKSDQSNSIAKSLLFYGVLGIMLVPFVFSKGNYLFQMSFLFGILMFMMMTILISDFSSVLLDLKDKDIILSRPVNGKTLSMAKTLHITIYMFYITFSFTGPSLLISLYRQGFLFFMVFLSEIILMDLLIVALTALLYLLILKFFDGEKLKDIINYVQIILSIALSIGYQLIGRLFDFRDMMNINFVPRWWQSLIPSMWFGGLFELILNNNYSSHIMLFSALALIIPVLSIILYIKLTSTFERNLQKLNDSSGNVKVRGKGFNYYLSGIFCRTKEEKTFFRFAADMMRSERNFKLKVYPSLGLSLILPLIFLLPKFKNAGWESLAQGKMYFNIYFVALIVPTILMTIGYSDKYKGAWIYNMLPFDDAGYIYKGTLKAVIINLLVPLYIFESIIFMIIFKGRIAIDLIIVFLNIILFIAICFKILKMPLPFSEAFGVVNQSQGLIIIPLFIAISVLAAVHYFAAGISYGRYIYILLSVIANLYIWKKFFDRKTILLPYEDEA